MKFHNINHGRIVCNYKEIHADRMTALNIAGKIGGELLEIGSNAIMFNTTDIESVTKSLTSLINK